MPQMFPLNWMFFLFFTLFILMVIMTFNFFSSSNQMKTYKIISSQKNKTFSLKW